METIIRPAIAADAERLNEALAALSVALGDPHAATAGDLARAGFGDNPAFRAQIAEAGDAVVGAAVYSPVFSTVRGGAGIYVSDLYVCEASRGTGLGRRLLAAAIADGREVWDARFIKLAVYDDNPSAAAFYRKLGFDEMKGECYLVLAGSDLASLKG